MYGERCDKVGPRVKRLFFNLLRTVERSLLVLMNCSKMYNSYTKYLGCYNMLFMIWLVTYQNSSRFCCCCSYSLWYTFDLQNVFIGWDGILLGYWTHCIFGTYPNRFLLCVNFIIKYIVWRTSALCFWRLDQSRGSTRKQKKIKKVV